MIKDFERFAKIQSVTINGARGVRWEETNADGSKSRVTIEPRATRTTVREAFKALRSGYEVAIFTKEDAARWLFCVDCKDHAYYESRGR